jgi:hypothetical protein
MLQLLSHFALGHILKFTLHCGSIILIEIDMNLAKDTYNISILSSDKDLLLALL